MLHHVLTAYPATLHAAPPAAVLALIASARRAIGDDPSLACRYLDHAVALFDAPDDAASEAGMLPAMADGASQGPARGGLAGWQVRKVAQHIEQELARPVPVETLATLCRLSVGHFCRAFKVSMGETPHNYLVRQRIRRAQALMLESDDGLSQIALACGFTDQAHLTRLFRARLDTTPMAWRRNWRRPG